MCNICVYYILFNNTYSIYVTYHIYMQIYLLLKQPVLLLSQVSPTLLSPSTHPLPLSLYSRKSRSPRNNNKTQQNKIPKQVNSLHKAKTLIPSLDKSVQKDKTSPKSRQKAPETNGLSILGGPQKHQANSHIIYTKDMMQTHVDPMLVVSVSYEPCSVDSV